MPLNSVLQHVKGVINGLAMPGQQSPLVAQVVPPPMEPLSGPIAFITPGPMKGKRQTMPRGPGFTGPLWQIDITLDLQDLPTDPLIEQAYYLCVDAIFAALWTDTMPVFITDPTTGVVTQLLAIGEDYGFTPGNWVATASGRIILFRGRLSTTIKEAAQTGKYTDKASG